MKNLIVLLLIGGIFVSCAKEDGITFKETPKGYDEIPYYSVYKTNADYSNYVYMSKTNQIPYKPNLKDTLNISGIGENYIKWWKGQPLTKDYYFIPFELNPESIKYTDVTYEEYDNLYNVFPSNGDIDSLRLLETMDKRIIDIDPFLEYYRFQFNDKKLCTIVDSSILHMEPNFEKINELIETGEFFTYEGVEKIK